MSKTRQGGFLIAKVHHVAGRVFASKLKGQGLGGINPAQGRILFALWEKDGIPIQDLAARTALGKSTLTSMLDRLEEAGYLARMPSADDRREILIKLTEKDRALRDVYARVSEEMTGLFYQGFTPEEIDRFEEYLARILDNLTALEKGS